MATTGAWQTAPVWRLELAGEEADAMVGSGGQAGPSVASKIFAVLDAFDGSASSLRLSVIAVRTGMPMPTALRVVRELVRWGGLEREGDGSYRVGQRLWVIGAGAPGLRRIREAALPHLHQLSGLAALDVELAFLDGSSALLLEHFGRGARAGDRSPLHATGVGKVLLAFAPALVVEDVLRRGLWRLTPYTVEADGKSQ